MNMCVSAEGQVNVTKSNCCPDCVTEIERVLLKTHTKASNKKSTCISRTSAEVKKYALLNIRPAIF